MRAAGRRAQFLAVAVVVFLGGCAKESARASAVEEAPRARQPVQDLIPEIVAVHPHDSGSFTQGLIWHDGSLYESAGGYGSSTLRRVDPETGKVLQSRDLPADVFGEGLAQVGERLIVLSWRENKALIFELETFSPAGELLYAGEGWGLCFNGEYLIMSDGGSSLTFRDPETFAISGRLPVTLSGVAQDRLNELECVGDYIYANLWGIDTIARIHSRTGEIDAMIDGSRLLSPEERAGVDVLNGIAFDPESRTFYLTGKNWPSLFEVTFIPK